MSIPAIPSLDHPSKGTSQAVFAALLGGGVCLLSLIVGLIILGAINSGAVAQDSITALATIGGSLAGGFGGWIARGTAERRMEEKEADARSDV